MSVALDRNDFVRALVLLYEDPERARTCIDGNDFAAGVHAACRAIQAEVMPSTTGPNGWARSNSEGVAGIDVNAAFVATMGDGNRRRGRLEVD